MVEAELRHGTERERQLALGGPGQERRHAFRRLMVHVRSPLVGRGHRKPLQPLALERQLRRAGVERNVMEQLEGAFVLSLELRLPDELHLPGGLERPIEQHARAVPVQ